MLVRRTSIRYKSFKQSIIFFRYYILALHAGRWIMRLYHYSVGNLIEMYVATKGTRNANWRTIVSKTRHLRLSESIKSAVMTGDRSLNRTEYLSASASVHSRESRPDSGILAGIGYEIKLV